MNPIQDTRRGGAERAESGFSPIAEIIDDIRKGRMVIIVDDEDRENEGDILMAAAKVRADRRRSGRRCRKRRARRRVRVA